MTLIDAKSLGIASGLVDLLAGAGQNEFIPAWLQGMAHVSNARSMEDDMQIQAGSSMKSSNSPEEVINEEFTEQDFRRTAAEGSFGVGKDTAYRSFDEEAYSDSDMDELEELGDTTTDEEFDSDLEPQSDNESFSQIHIDAAFYRQEPSKQLVKMASEDISDTPSKGILNSLKSNQRLRFEYIGLFPFSDISHLLMNTSEKSSNDIPKILMVAEKPSIANAIAEALSRGNRPPRQRRLTLTLPVYEFTTNDFAPDNSKSLVRVTSVVGHVYSLGFDVDQKERQRDPRDYFSLPVAKKEEGTTSKLRVVDHLKALSGDSEHLVPIDTLSSVQCVF